MTPFELHRRLCVIDPKTIAVVVPLELFWECADTIHAEWRAGRTGYPMTSDELPVPNLMLAGHWIVGCEAP